MPFDESHVDDDLLALLALGEPAGSTADLAHIEECERCTDELTSLRDVVGLARSGGADAPLVAPAPQVWDRVAAELGLAADASASPALAPVAAGRPAVARRPPQAAAGRRRRPGRRRSTRAALAPGAGSPRPPRSVWWSVGVRRGGSPAKPDAATVIATAVLEPLPGWDASGSAVVETLSDGSRVLVVDLEQDESSDDGFREVWLLKPDVSGLVSVGTLEGSSGRFDLPAGLDLDQFSVVDVSEEQFDGDPAHSGDSIVRGPLEA